MVQGKLNKARRGELHFHLPMGYIRRPSGEVTLDSDEQVLQVVKLIFRKFEELGTLNAVLRYLVKHNVQLGARVRANAPNFIQESARGILEEYSCSEKNSRLESTR